MKATIMKKSEKPTRPNTLTRYINSKSAQTLQQRNVNLRESAALPRINSA
jgi:hypothetical protein